MPQAALKVLDGGRASKCSPTTTVERDARAEFDGVVEWIKEQACEPRLFFGVERALVSRVFALGRLLVRLYLAMREERIAEALPSRSRVDGQWYERRPAQRRSLGTFFGKVSYPRSYLLPEGRKGHGFHPLDKELGLTADRFSLHVISLACRLAVLVPFEQARRLLQRFLGWSPAHKVIERMVLGLGSYVEQYFEEMPAPVGDGEVLVTQIDLKCIPTARERELKRRRGKRRPNPHPGSARHRGRHKRREYGPKRRRRKGDKSKNGKAATLVVMYTLRVSPEDGLLLGPINKVVYASFACKRHAFAWAKRQAEKRGFYPGSNQLMQFVSDGDRHFPDYIAEYFGDYAEHELLCTIDLPHVMEYLWSAGTARYKEGSTELATWARRQKTRLLESRADLILADLRRWLDQIPKSGPGNKAKRASLKAAIRYLENNIDRIDYQYVRECDLELASGAVEGAVNHVIGLRLDKGGMRWIRERAHALLQLRCIEINGQWDDFIQWVQERLHVSTSTVPRLLRTSPAHILDLVA
jgi:hypothetical protein